ncbi:MAG: hypothetical protein ABJN38_11820, partial [Lentilitoribacter sp.]
DLPRGTVSFPLSGIRPIWPNLSLRNVDRVVRTKISRILPKTEFFNTISPLRRMLRCARMSAI